MRLAIIILLAISCSPKPAVDPPSTARASEVLSQPVAKPVAKPVAPPILYARPYIVQPGDWLSKIALVEYGDTTKWHHIYAWNRAKIGDNPDWLYPYTVLQLRKSIPYHGDQQYKNHVVRPGETLWSIAKSEYGDPRAWLLIFNDNRGIITGIAQIPIGLRLRIRHE